MQSTVVEHEVQRLRVNQHDDRKKINEIDKKLEHAVLTIDRTTVLLEDISTRLTTLENEKQRRDGAWAVVRFIFGKWFTIFLMVLLAVSVGLHDAFVHLLKHIQ